MKYKAVVFDLFGTLVDIYNRRRYYKLLEEMIVILSVPGDEFTRLWFDTAAQRGSGFFESTEDNIAYICRQIGVPVDEEKVKESALLRLNSVRDAMIADRRAMDIVPYLKSEGYKVGLVSNCSPEAPIIWKELPFARFFDTAVFSCLVGLRKPSPEIYRLAAERLGVEPGDCLYVGDGDDGELDGAAETGMHPVLISDPEISLEDTLRNEELQWSGPVITSLKEVTSFL